MGQPLQHVADIADQRARRRIDRQPLAVAVQDLEPSLFRAKQQGDDVDVLVRGGADVRAVERPPFLSKNWRIVQQPQDRIAEVDRRIEEMPVEAQVDGDRFQDLQTHLVERAIEPAHGLMEFRHIRVRPDVVRHVAAVGMARRQVAPDVPKLLQVVVHLALGGLDAEGGVAALATDWQLVFQLLGLGQGEEPLGRGDRRIDARLRDPMVGNDRKAEPFERGAEGVGEVREVAAEAFEGDGRDAGRQGVGLAR